MFPPKPSVDDFWANLKAKNAPKAVSAALTKEKEQSPEAKAVHEWAAPQEQPTRAWDAAALPPSDQIGSWFRQVTEAFKDPTLAKRKQALQNLKAILSNPDTGKVKYDASQPEGLDEGALGKALLRRFDDQSQACRDLAVSNLCLLLQAFPQAILTLLPYAIPVLEERIAWQPGGKTPVESAEEVRLALARTLHTLVSGGGKAVGAYLEEVHTLCCIEMEDPFHEVAQQACSTVMALEAALGMRIAVASKQLIASLLPLTTHKRHRVRVAAIQAVSRVMHQNGHEMILEMVAFRDPNVIPVAAFYGNDLKVNFAGKLAIDPHPQVRLAWLRCVGDWMLNLRERLDHESRLLPYVMSALDDPTPQIVEEAVALLDTLGAAYEKEHEQELRETVYYLPDDAHGTTWQGALGDDGMHASSSNRVASFVYVGSLKKGVDGVVDAAPTTAAGRTLFVMPGPLVARPRLGTRLLVGGHLGRTVAPLCNELMGAWQDEPRSRAALLLRIMLVVAEEAAHQHLAVLIPALCRSAQEPVLRPIVLECASVLACFVQPHLLIKTLVPRAADETAETQVRASALSLMSAIIRGAGARGAADVCLPDVLNCIVGSDALLRPEGPVMRGAVAQLVCDICSACGPACAQEWFRLLWIALHLTSSLYTTSVTAEDAVDALSVSNQPAQQQEAQGRAMVLRALPAIARSCGYGSVDKLVAAGRAALLGKCCPDQVAAVGLEAAVLGQLLLTRHAAAPALLCKSYNPAMLLQPAHCDGSTHSQCHDGPAPAQLWTHESLAAAVDVLNAQLPLLNKHTQSTVYVLACLEESLVHIKSDMATCQVELMSTGTAGSVSLGQAILQLLVQLILGAPANSSALTLAMRCAQQCASLGLVPHAELSNCCGPLLCALVGKGFTSTSGNCRLQACATAASALHALDHGRVALDQDLVQLLHASLSALLADSNTSVQAAAQAALGVMVESRLR